jgi:hypothetical protein
LRRLMSMQGWSSLQASREANTTPDRCVRDNADHARSRAGPRVVLHPGAVQRAAQQRLRVVKSACVQKQSCHGRRTARH